MGRNDLAMRALAILVTLLLSLAGLSPANAQQRLLHQERSLYRNIFVIQDGQERCMLFRYPRPFGRESCKLLNDPNKLIFDYTQMMLSGLYLNPHPKKLLIIGEGGGTIPTVLQQMYPDLQIDQVEIDAAVDRVAKEYFDFKPGPNTKIFIEDGRVYVKRAAAQKPNYDMVLLDAFDADYIPEHMLTREFLQEVKAIMAPDGVIVANTFSNSALYDYESVTYSAVFGTFFNLKLGNRIILGKLDGLPPMDQIRANAMQLETALNKFNTGQGFLMPLLTTQVDWNKNARILTDQYSPSNLLNALPR
jgi:spermidine synthase